MYNHNDMYRMANNSFGPTWIGGTDNKSEGAWMYSDGTNYDPNIVPLVERGDNSESELNDCARVEKDFNGEYYMAHPTRCEDTGVNAHMCKIKAFQGKIPCFQLNSRCFHTVDSGFRYQITRMSELPEPIDHA